MKSASSIAQLLLAPLALAACGAVTPNSQVAATDVPAANMQATEGDQPAVHEVESFVRHWFSLFDRRVNVNEITSLLTDDIHADFIGQVLPSRDAFAAMYEGSIATLTTADHNIENIRVVPKPNGALVQTWVHFRSTDEQLQTVDMHVQQTWRLIWLGGSHFQVAEYVVRPALSDAESKKLQDRAQAVLYRWFYFYETAAPDFEAQYMILADDVHIQGTVSVQSLAEYKAALENPYFVFGLNAHHVESVEFSSVTPSATTLAVSILYQGIDKEGATHAYRMSYAIQMVEVGSPLPKIKFMTITPVSDAEKVFVSAYSENFNKAQNFEQQAVTL